MTIVMLKAGIYGHRTAIFIKQIWSDKFCS